MRIAYDHFESFAHKPFDQNNTYRRCDDLEHFLCVVEMESMNDESLGYNEFLLNRTDIRYLFSSNLQITIRT